MALRFGPVVPILRIFSVEKAREFYVGFLGFTWDWEHRFGPGFPLYVQVSRGGLALHLSEHHGDGTPGTTIILKVEGLELLQKELTERRYAYARPGLEEAPWGEMVMDVTDPFGNRLSFRQGKG